MKKYYIVFLLCLLVPTIALIINYFYPPIDHFYPPIEILKGG